MLRVEYNDDRQIEDRSGRPWEVLPQSRKRRDYAHESPQIRRLRPRHIYASSGREYRFYFHFKRAIRSSLRTLEAFLTRCLRIAQAGNRRSSIRNNSTSVLLVGLVPRVCIHRPRLDDRGCVTWLEAWSNNSKYLAGLRLQVWLTLLTHRTRMLRRGMNIDPVDLVIEILFNTSNFLFPGRTLTASQATAAAGWPALTRFLNAFCRQGCARPLLLLRRTERIRGVCRRFTKVHNSGYQDTEDGWLSLVDHYTELMCWSSAFHFTRDLTATGGASIT
jgi:hypothetical protein